MSAIPVLKKKLKSIRATAKLSAAMKTVSAAKYSKLSLLWKTYSGYAEQYRFLFTAKQLNSTCETVVVLGSNRSFCGGFNNEILRYFKEENQQKPQNLILCGNEIISGFKEIGITADYTFCFGDIPKMEECKPLFELLCALAEGKKDYPVKIIHNYFKNALTQLPKTDIILLNPSKSEGLPEDTLWIPDKAGVCESLLEKSFHTSLFGAVLETALGAQAATLMTMRSAYDTANEYSASLENEIQRTRQSEVTADVIETRGGNGNA
ncbi:MAG: F0F1 ATP synthase subunit gamma [Clostridiales bacterium]|nr:F0F1 ATP synthase subunit gamma [Candidatus Equinaster intestinalis]